MCLLKCQFGTSKTYFSNPRTASGVKSTIKLCPTFWVHFKPVPCVTLPVSLTILFEFPRIHHLPIRLHPIQHIMLLNPILRRIPMILFDEALSTHSIKGIAYYPLYIFPYINKPAYRHVLFSPLFSIKSPSKHHPHQTHLYSIHTSHHTSNPHT